MNVKKQKYIIRHWNWRLVNRKWGFFNWKPVIFASEEARAEVKKTKQKKEKEGTAGPPPQCHQWSREMNTWNEYVKWTREMNTWNGRQMNKTKISKGPLPFCQFSLILFMLSILFPLWPARVAGEWRLLRDEGVGNRGEIGSGGNEGGIGCIKMRGKWGRRDENGEHEGGLPLRTAGV